MAQGPKIYQPSDITQPISGPNQLKIYTAEELQPRRPPEPVYTDDPSWLQQFSDSWINQPLSKVPTYLADLVAEPMMKFGESGTEWYRTPALYGGAFLHNVGEGISGLTTPLNLVTAGTLGTASALGRGSAYGGLTTTAKEGARQLIGPSGMFTPKPGIAGPLATAGKIMSAPVAAAGLGHMGTAENLPEFLMGGLETVGGLAGMRYKVPGPIHRTPNLSELLPFIPDTPTDFNAPPQTGRPYGPRQLPDLISREEFTPDMREYLGQMGHTISGENAEGYQFMGRPGAHSPLPTPTGTPDLPLNAPDPPIIARRGWTPQLIEYYLQRGYERGGVLPDGRAYMRKPGTPLPPSGASIPEPPPIQTQEGPAASAEINRPIPFNSDEGFALPSHTLTRSDIEGLRQQGYEQSGINEKGESIFKRLLRDEEGSIDFDEIRRAVRGEPPAAEQMRIQNQLRNISEAGDVAGDVDLGPRPTMESFDPPTTDPTLSKLEAEIREIIRVRRGAYGSTTQFPSVEELMRNAHEDLRHIRNITDMNEAHRLSSRWHDIWDQNRDNPDETTRIYADNMATAAGRRAQELDPNVDVIPPEPLRSVPDWVPEPEPAMPPSTYEPPNEPSTFIRVSEPPSVLNREMRSADIDEIQQATPREIRRIVTFWEQQLENANSGDNTDLQKHAEEMLRAARRRQTQLDESGVIDTEVIEDPGIIGRTADRTSGTGGPTPETGGVGEFEIRSATDANELDILNTQWHQAYTNAYNAADQAGMQRASEMLEMIAARRNELRMDVSLEGAQLTPFEQAVQELRTQIAGATTADELEALTTGYSRRLRDIGGPGSFPFDLRIEIQDLIRNRREAIRGQVDNPPITFGLQPVSKGPVKLTKEQYSRMKEALPVGESEADAARAIERRREKNTRKVDPVNNSWDSFSLDNLSRMNDGPPGLSIEDASSTWAKRYYVVYRGPDGKPVAMAKVNEDTGRRAVSTLAADRSKGMLYGRAVKAVGEALIKMNATEAYGSTSKYTQHLIRMSKRLLSDDSGFIDFGKLDPRAVAKEIKNESKRVEAVFGLSKSRKFNSIEEFEELMEDLSAKGSKRGIIDTFLSTVNPVRSGGGGGNIPPLSPTTGRGGGPGGPGGRGKKPSWLRELYNLPRGVTTTADLSAPLRQGLALITRKEWWSSWNQMIKSLGSEGAYQKTLADLRARPMFQSSIDPVTKKVTKSFAEQAGIKLMDVSEELTGREEAVASNWVESGEFLGSAAPAYQKTLGRAARASNRAYTAFLNQLRADTFESLIKDSLRDFEAGTKGSKNPITDVAFRKEIGDFVNTATGRGPLRTALPGVVGGRVGLKEYSLERNAKLLTDAIFSPRLMASRVRMLNPATYAMASPFVRKQYVKALLSVAGAWGSISGLSAGAGADVNTDMNSADFGKIKIGDTRLDPAAGFQQYLVAATRLIKGKIRSSSTGQEHELGAGFRADTRADVMMRFASNKLHPVIKFGWDLASASQYQPFQVGDRTIQMFVPLIVQDTIELIREDPNLLPLLAPIVAGMGTQTYSKGEAVSKFIQPRNDIVFRGGELY